MNADDGAPPQTVRAFGREALRMVATADGRTLRSFRDLIRHPGHLTREYMEGRGAKYINPIELFLLTNLLFFVIGGIMDNHMLTTNLNSQLCCQVHSPLANRVFYRHVNELKRGSWNDARRDTVTEQAPDSTWKEWTEPAVRLTQYHAKYRLLVTAALARFEAHFDDASDQNARTLIILMVPLLALGLALLEFRRGSGVQHIAFALHFYSFALVLYTALSAFAVLVLAPLHIGVSDGAWGVVLVSLQTIYLIIALGAAYGDGWTGRILRGVAAGYATILILEIYRLILFFIAYVSAK